MVSLRRHFVPNPVVIHSTCRGSRRRQPLSIHTRYDVLGYLGKQMEMQSLMKGDGRVCDMLRCKDGTLLWFEYQRCFTHIAASNA